MTQNDQKPAVSRSTHALIEEVANSLAWRFRPGGQRAHPDVRVLEAAWKVLDSLHRVHYEIQEIA